jgi:hypothetical protein
VTPAQPPVIDIYGEGPARVGRGARTGRPNRERPDVAAAHPAYSVGQRQGFEFLLQAEPGDHQVCAYAIVRDPDLHVDLGCRWVRVPGPGPGDGQGWLDNAYRVPEAGVRAAGWAASLDGLPYQPVRIEVFASDPWGPTPDTGLAWRANRPRPDVQAAVPGTGPSTGFDLTVTSDAGTAALTGPVGVCAFSGRALLGCRLLGPIPASGLTGRVTVGSGSGDTFTVRFEADSRIPGYPITSYRAQLYYGGAAGTSGVGVGPVGWTLPPFEAIFGIPEDPTEFDAVTQITFSVLPSPADPVDNEPLPQYCGYVTGPDGVPLLLDCS